MPRLHYSDQIAQWRNAGILIRCVLLHPVAGSLLIGFNIAPDRCVIHIDHPKIINYRLLTLFELLEFLVCAETEFVRTWSSDLRRSSSPAS